MMLNENALSQLTTISAILTLTLQAGNTVESDVGKNGRSRNGSFVVKGVTSYWAYEKERKREFFFSRLLKLEQVIHTKKTSDNNIPFMKKYQSLGSDRRTLSVQQLAKFLTRRNEESGWLNGIYRNPVRLKHKQVMWNMHGGEVSLFKIQRTRRFFKQKSSFKSFRRKLLFAEDNSVKSADKRLEISGSSGSEKDRNISVTVFSSFEDMGGTTEISKNMTSEEYEEEVFRIRHRLRNNEDAMWGLACVSFILVLLVWGVWFSGMCKGSRDTLVYAEYSTSIQSMSVREMLKNRAKFLPIFRRFRRKKKQDDEIPLIDDVMAADSDDDKLFERGWESMELPS